jgi:hypothetical protein
MSMRWPALAVCLLSMSVVAAPPLAGSAEAQKPGSEGATAPAVPAKPGLMSRLSPSTITRELELGVEKLRKALDSQTNGPALSSADTAKGIYAGYVHVRAAHALLTRRMTRLSEKTQSPDPLLQAAFDTIKGARYKVLHAREAAARANTARSVELLSAAIPELERAIALIY